MSDLAAALRSVRDGYSEYEYVRRVKTAVIDEMQRIDASVQVEDTQYFNHSAIPDLLVRWKGEVQSRPLYLRGSYAAIIAARDASYITSGQPILVAMDPEQQDYDEPVDHQRLIEEASSAPSTLITDAAAMGALADPPLTTETPLGPLVRANYLRGGRGLIDPERARTLVEAGSSEALAREGLQEIVRQSFLPDAALRLERTAQLIDLALSQRALEDEQLVNADLLSGTGGRLSVSELRAILPWLMRQDGLTDDGRFWSRLGDLLDLRLLERAGGELVDVDISRLVRANANKWLCRRAYLGLSVLQGDDSVASSADGTWTFRGGVLGVDFGSQRIAIASDGRSLPGRDSLSEPSWDTLKTALGGFQVVSTVLKGIARSVSVTAEETEDIQGDVDGVVGSVNDRFSVAELSIRSGQPAGDAVDIELNFGRAIATAGPAATIQSMLLAAGLLLAFREPLGREQLSMR